MKAGLLEEAMAILELGLLFGGVAGLAIGRWGGHQERYLPITEVLPLAATQMFPYQSQAMLQLLHRVPLLANLEYREWHRELPWLWRLPCGRCVLD